MTFKSVYNSTKEAIHAAKEPLVRAKNERALAAAIDSAKEAKLNAEEALAKAYSVVNEAKVIDFNAVLTQRQIIANADATIKELTDVKAEFFDAEETKK